VTADRINDLDQELFFRIRFQKVSAPYEESIMSDDRDIPCWIMFHVSSLMFAMSVVGTVMS
jgi:hypothetical protein